MTASTSEGTGPGSAADILPKLVNGVVKTENLAKNAVLNVDVSDNAVDTAEIANSAVTTAKIANSSVTTAKLVNGSVTVAKMAVFKSTEQTGTGSAQNIAHGLGASPALVIVYPTDTNVSTTGDYVVTEGSHTTTNVVVTVTNGKKYRVVAFA
jgi:hypothetical protein